MILGVAACAASLFACGATRSIALLLASGSYNWGLEQHPMVPLLAIWLRLLTWLPPQKNGMVALCLLNNRVAPL